MPKIPSPRLSAVERRRRFPTARSDWLEVTCWCEGSLVMVPPVEVRAGLTRPCRSSQCERRAQEAQAREGRQP